MGGDERSPHLEGEWDPGLHYRAPRGAPERKRRCGAAAQRPPVALGPEAAVPGRVGARGGGGARAPHAALFEHKQREV